MACNLQELGFMESFIMQSPANFFDGIALGAHSTLQTILRQGCMTWDFMWDLVCTP
jgi:hypothetical protein